MEDKPVYAILGNGNVFFLDFPKMQEKPIEWYLDPAFKSWKDFNFFYQGNKKHGTPEEEQKRKAKLDELIYKKGLPLIAEYKRKL